MRGLRSASLVAAVVIALALAAPAAASAAPVAGFGNALALTNAGQTWLEAPLTPYTAFSGASDFTAEMWIKPSEGTRNWNSTLFREEPWAYFWEPGRLVWWLILDDQGRLGGGVNDCNHWQWLPTSTLKAADGVWSHVAFVKNGTSVEVYLNGQLATQLTADSGVMAAQASNMPIYFGGDRLQGNYFDGQMDEIRVWNTALSAATLNDWSYRGVDASHPSAENLVAYYKVDETSGTSAADTSGLSGSATFANMGVGSFVASSIGLNRTTDKNTPLSTRLAYSATGAGAPNVTVTDSAAHGLVQITAAATGNYTYTPTTGYAGPDSFSYTVTDASGTSSAATVALTVTGVADPVDEADEPSPVISTPASSTWSIALVLTLGFGLLAAVRTAPRH